LLTLILLRLLT